MSRAEIVFPSLIFALAGALVLTGLFVLPYSWTVMAFPFGAGVAVCLFCLIDIGLTLSGRRPRRSDLEAPPEPLSLASLSWAFALGGFVYALGFVFGPAAYLFTYLRAHGSSWLFSLAVGAVSLLITWGLFIKVLRILLPVEPLWWSS
jgi:hypothetical protein